MKSDLQNRPGLLATRLLHRMVDGQSHALAMLARDLADSTERVSNAAAVLRRRKLLISEQVGQYRLSAGGIEAARHGAEITSGPVSILAKVGEVDDSLCGRAWWAMRFRKVFTVADLVADATRGEATAPRVIGQFVRRLQAAGFVRGLSKRTPRPSPATHGQKQYQLIRNSGPLTPVWRSSLDAVVDRNTKETLPCKRG